MGHREVRNLQEIAARLDGQRNVGNILEPITLRAEAGEVIYPEHGTGRTAPLATCGHCHGKPLLVRRCPPKDNPSTFCAVCQKCGHHTPITRAEPTRTLAESAQLKLEIRQVKAIVGRLEGILAKKGRQR
jgi:hypothetical protein